MAYLHIKLLADRLGTRMRASPAKNITIKEGTTVVAIVALIAATAKGVKVNRLSLLAHGFSVNWSGGTSSTAGFTAGMTYSKQGGGYGLEMGTEITLHNVARFVALKPYLAPDAVIDIYACFAADVSPDIPPRLLGDGESLMRALAAATGATVRASRAAHNFINGGSWVDVGTFDGPVLQFKPDGSIVPELFSRIEDYP